MTHHPRYYVLDDGLDRERLSRHEFLLKYYDLVPVEELLADLVFLTQLAAFEHHRQQVLGAALVAHAQGATHECSEWIRAGRCAICGRVTAPLPEDRT